MIIWLNIFAALFCLACSRITEHFGDDRATWINLGLALVNALLASKDWILALF